MLLEHYFEQPHVVHIGTQPDRAYYIPHTDTESALTNRREASSRFVLLSGEWEFRYYECLREVEQDAVYPGFTATFDTLPVPSCWQNHGYGNHQYSNRKYPFPFDPPYVPDKTPCGLYRRRFSINAEQVALSCYLNFEGVDCCYYVWVNGCFIGYSEVSHSTSEFDITGQLQQGNNALCVLVFKWGAASYLEDQDKLRMSGIFRDVYLLLRSREHIRDFFVHAEPNDDFSRADVCAELELTGAPRVIGTLLSPQGQVLERQIAQNGNLRFEVEKPKLWNAESPVLYQLMLEAAGEVIVQDVGIRRVEVQSGVLLLNGVPVKFRGVNRHDSDPVTGYTISHEQAITDLRMMKAHNINAIRTSHYPNAPWFPQLCSRFGFYLMAEADLEAHGAVDIFDGSPSTTFGLIVQDPRFATAVMDRVQKNVMRDKNNACILIWSLGNESGYGPAMEEAGRWCKRYDPDRLLHYEGSLYETGGHRNDCSMLDVYSRMYAPVRDIEAYFADSNNKKPYLLCEYIHAMGCGPGDAEDYFERMDRYPGFCGGFVWEWCDHSVYRGLTNDGRRMYGYGGDFGETISDGNYCMDGLVTPDRRSSTGLRNLAAVNRPVRARLNPDRTLTLRNMLDFTDLNELVDISCELSRDGEIVARSKISDIHVAPHLETVLPLPFDIPDFGQCYLNLFYRQKYSLPLTPAGHCLGHDQLELRAQPVKLNLPNGNDTLTCTETETHIVVGNERFEYTFSKLNGAFDTLVHSQHAYLAAPMRFNIWRAPTDNDRQRERPGIDARPRPRWEEAGYDRAQARVYQTTLHQEPSVVLIRCRLSLAPVHIQKIIDIDACWRIDGEGSITLSCECIRNPQMPYLPRFGLLLPLFKQYAQVEYFGYGPDESYSDMHHSSYIGRFYSNVRDLHVDYIRPQENGSHFGCRYIDISNGDATLHAISTTPFCFNASHYTFEELCRARHNYELQESDLTLLCLDYKNSGVGSNACGPLLLEQYQLREVSFRWEIQISLA